MPFVSEAAIADALRELKRTTVLTDLLAMRYLAPAPSDGSGDDDSESAVRYFALNPTGRESGLAHALDTLGSLFPADASPNEEGWRLHRCYRHLNSTLHSYYFPFAEGGPSGSKETAWKLADYNRSGTQRRFQQPAPVFAGWVSYRKYGGRRWLIEFGDDYRERVFTALLRGRALPLWAFSAWVLRFCPIPEGEPNLLAWVRRTALDQFRIPDELPFVAADEASANAQGAWFYVGANPDPTQFFQAARLEPRRLIELCVEDSGAQPESLARLFRNATSGNLYDLLRDAGAGKTLLVSDELLGAIETHIRLGSHILLMGPPGTGKSTLARNIANVAQQGLFEGQPRPHGYIFTTATASWTTFDTVGGYVPEAEGHGLEFRPGIFLRALSENKWVIVDELNRSDADKAFGQFLTVLSGLSEVISLPYEVRRGDGRASISILPPGPPADQDEHQFRVPDGWRMIGTLNTFDKNTLFRLSYAFLRRFAAVYVDTVSPEDATAIAVSTIEAEGNRITDLQQTKLEALLTLAEQVRRPLGPAIAIDVARYVAARSPFIPEPTAIGDAEPLGGDLPQLELSSGYAATAADEGPEIPSDATAAAGVPASDPFLEALLGFVLPQLEGLDPRTLRQLRNKLVTEGIVQERSSKLLERYFEQFLDLSE